MKKKVTLHALVAATACFVPFVAGAQGYLENPQPGRVESGISLVSGWHCTAKEVRVYIDGVDIGKSGVGSVRNDTASICGHANTGFSVLYNYSKLTPGTHSIAVYVDGVHLETREFNSVRSGGVPFLEGAQSVVEAVDFPEAGMVTALRWSQAKQSFVVEESIPADYSHMVAALLYRPFFGAAHRRDYPLQGDPTQFEFEVTGDTLKLTRISEQNGTCVFTGDYKASPLVVQSKGTYTCSDSTAGTYSGGFVVSGFSAYSGSLGVKPNGSPVSAVENHVGYDRSFGMPF